MSSAERAGGDEDKDDYTLGIYQSIGETNPPALNRLTLRRLP